MSFLLPNRRGDPAPRQTIHTQTEAKSGAVTTTKYLDSTLYDPSTQEDETHDDGLALQALDEAAFVRLPENTAVDQSRTLIPKPFAQLVTTTTGLTTLTVRTYSRAFHWGLGLGREATLRSLELTRAGIEGVLRTAAKDVSGRREASRIGRTEAENTLARSISALHWAFSSASFWAAGGFEAAELSLGSVEGFVLQGLGTLNAILGSTESSRAVSAIITLIKEELLRPDSEDGSVPGYWDCIVGVAGFVILQRWGRRRTALEFKANGGEETIWDVVIDDRGFRADVVGTRRHDGNQVTTTRSVTTAKANAGERDLDGLTIERGLDLEQASSIALSAQDQTKLSDEEIRDRILAQLPRGTKAVVTSETMTMKTVKVDIHGSVTAHIEAPPGLTMVSEHLGTNPDDSGVPHQRIVFQTCLKRSSSAEIEPVERLRMTGLNHDVIENGEADENGLTMSSSSRLNRSEYPDHDRSMGHLNIDPPSTRASNEERGPVANQKKARKPIISTPSSFDRNSAKSLAGSNKDHNNEEIEKSGIIKKALKSFGSSQPVTNKQDKSKRHSPSTTRKDTSPLVNISPMTRLDKTKSSAPKRVYPMPEQVDYPLDTSPAQSPTSRRETTTSYFTVHEKKRESTISQTDSFSIHSTESRPGSPTNTRAHARADSGLFKTKSQTEISMQPSVRLEVDEAGNLKNHHRSRSFVPSLYSMGTKNSDEAIILQPKTAVHRSIFEDHKMLTALATEGKVPGTFPDRHFVKSIRRFARFASASYGSNFLRVMGITPPEGSLSPSTELTLEEVHHEHTSFATHTGLPANTILLSGFCDPKGVPGGTVSGGQHTMTPLMHFISIDHDSKAVVLTCRGTLGFEDVLTDMTCDYDEIHWQGRSYEVHEGIHTSARRLLGGVGSRVMATIRASLEEFPDYGLVLCGHSLGGAVAAMLALLISEPNRARQFSVGAEADQENEVETSFVTAAQPKLLTDKTNAVTSTPPVVLPAGRPVHVFAYGPPASFSPTLRLATRGLITTIINHNDIVPSLSLGTLHDFKAIALHLKQDPSSPLVRLKFSMIEKVKSAMLGNFWNRESSAPTPAASTGMPVGEGDEEWQWTALTTLRNLMINDKLLPPGEVFIIETNRVFDRLDPNSESGETRDGEHADTYRPLGRAATRVQFKLVRNVESRFREVRFGSGMFGDHSPGRYEGALGALERGICEDV